MSYNGSGTFVINSAGTPYVSGTVISSTAANALNSDLATGLSTAICKDGQTTVTANIPLGGFRITGLGAGTVASDAARLSQVQNSTTTTLISITGTDTITGTVSPTLTAYATGQVFSFVVAATNTGAVTLNVDSIGVKSVTRTGAVALVAGDLVTGQIAVVEYDGTRFQLINGNSFSNLNVSGTLGVTGITTVAAGSAALPSIVSTTGTADTGQWFPAADTIAWSTAGTERVRVTSIGNVGIGTSSPFGTNTNRVVLSVNGTTDSSINIGQGGSQRGYFYCTSSLARIATIGAIPLVLGVNDQEYMRINSSGILLLGTTSTIATNPSAIEIVNTAWMATWRCSGAAAGKYWQWYVDSGNTIALNNNGAVGVQLTDGATSWAALSDETEKDIIEPITNGLEKIVSLRSVIGKYKTDEISKRRSFLIAQDVEKVLPEAVDVTINMETELPSLILRYSDIIPLLVSAIKDLKTITEAQAIRITALETA